AVFGVLSWAMAVEKPAVEEGGRVLITMSGDSMEQDVDMEIYTSGTEARSGPGNQGPSDIALTAGLRLPSGRLPGSEGGEGYEFDQDLEEDDADLRALEIKQLRALLPADALTSTAGAAPRELPIRVLCRFRGQSESEENRGGQEAWELGSGRTASHVSASEATSRVLGALPEFSFDRVFGPDASQEDVYNAVDPVVRGVLGDLSGCVMCYGQTSAGKTHTMEGYEDDLR
ncbi:unnamed protein product, partial [Polarella glacialis]